ncbi:carbohydrate ABC transporter permease [Actinacidiphila oryziradicis]|uniref:Carbohydrate ABC transporter permease n=1 Tax=Actinacidiphila oryziradicis TaxID=2571141 RepID=A0A4U0SGS2_9ACTN|nr:carbohydrate ABC transporter permease [Actinacidiphila oryziradicis]TKA08682.1 carbohydrate ABC transporter permease [Actinacidiphila oryziradicis]
MIFARRSAIYLILVALATLFIGPFGWLIITALKSSSELTAYPVHWLPASWQFGNFSRALNFIPFLGYARNSLIIATIYSVLITISSAWAGFGFARLTAPGKKVLFGVLLSTMMMPAMITLIPTYIIFAKLGMIDTYWPWVLWGLAGAPYLIFLFRQFFSNMPQELEEAAIVDGCGYGRIFWRIFLPQSWPVLATSMVLSFSWSWGDYIAPSLLLSTDRTTLAVAVATQYTNPANDTPVNEVIAAGSVLYIIPVLVLFLILQRGFVSGVATSGLK